ncbi:MAG: acetate--CoA ligase family protein [Methanoregulaceae archaeon]
MTGDGGKKEMLSEAEGYRLLSSYGIRVPEYVVAATPEEAGQSAERIGFPVVLKVVSPDVVHKSDTGGVVPGISSRDEAEQAFGRIRDRLFAGNPSAGFQGVMVEEQLAKGTELILGGRIDPAFGRILTVGSGGILVELVRDAAIRVLPVSRTDILAMLRELRVYPLLQGFRSIPASDLDFLVQTIESAQKLFLEHPEITEFDINPLILYPKGGCAVDARIFVTPGGVPSGKVQSDHPPVPARLFHPGSIAVVGASSDPGKVGYAILRNLLAFPGKLYPVNPKYREILGRRSYSSLAEVKASIDTAVIAVPAPLVPGIIDEAGKAGVSLAIIISSGFRESGHEGLLLEQEVTGIAASYGMRVMGPNCLGLMIPGLKINTTFDPISPWPGRIAFISQSGAIITTIVDWSLPEEIGFSAVISVGNQADLGFGEYLEYAAHDEATRAIILYVEEIRDGRNFIDRVREVTEKKPVIVLKSGSSRKGRLAASSHTGSLAGSFEVYHAAFLQAGMVPVESLREAFQTAELLASEGYPKGKRAVVITSAGGFAVLASDYADRFGIGLPEIPEDVHREMDTFLPNDWNHENPMDLIGDATSDRFARVFDILIQHQDFWDIAFVISVPTATIDPMRLANEIIRFSRHTRKMMVGCMIGGDSMRAAVRILRAQGIPNFEDMEDAFRAVGKSLRPIRNRPEEGEPPGLA